MIFVVAVVVLNLVSVQLNTRSIYGLDQSKYFWTYKLCDTKVLSSLYHNFCRILNQATGIQRIVVLSRCTIDRHVCA